MRHEKPQISIVCPTFNRAHTLARAITSVIGQDFACWELLIIDDGSTDNTNLVVGEFARDDRVKYFRQEGNRGVGFARNVGVCAASGDWILLLDSDNALCPGALNAVHNAIELAPDIMIHKFCVSSFDGAAMGARPRDADVISADDYLCGRYPGEFHTCVRKELLLKHKFFEEFSGGESIIWSQIAIECGYVAYHSVITQKYDTSGDDRLSVRRRNFERLEKVFRADIRRLWRDYVRACPLQLFLRVGKWAIYAILSAAFMKKL